MGRRRRTTGAVVLVVLLLGGCAALLDNGEQPAGPSAQTRPTATPSTRSRPTPPEQRHETATGRSVLAALAHTRVLQRRPFPGGYDRDCGPGDGCVFGTAWTDDTTAPDSHNGCDTRNDVLREQVDHPVIAPDTQGCKVVGGTFHDPYTGRTFDVAVHRSAIQIDHLVPLAYAWDMGAWRWPQPRRERFANDTELELLASWGPANESKGDSGPGDWLPVNRSFRCPYLLKYLRAIDAYDLAITAADASSIRYTARGCPLSGTTLAQPTSRRNSR